MRKKDFKNFTSTYPVLETAEHEHILNDDALQFIYKLVNKFQTKIEKQLALRQTTQDEIDTNAFLTNLSMPKSISDNWTINKLPADLLDRRVEITGPVNRKMIINALNSGANVFMADFEDSTAPTWNNVINGQVNLYDAVRKQITYYDVNKQKTYTLNDSTAVLFVRPRGFHLYEKHVLINGVPVLGALLDFGLYFFHNAHELCNQKTAPYFYLPKLENYHEAQLWNEIFVEAQNLLNIPQGTIKATVLIETITATFHMDAILYVLKEHSAGLNCGRWDYIFSFIKRFNKVLNSTPNFCWPDRNNITMEQPFMRAYTQALVQTCHKRNAPAIGGMSAFIPVKNDEPKNKSAFKAIHTDKIREVTDGHDGTWVAHPGLVGYVKEIFDYYMNEKNQIYNKRDDFKTPTPHDYLKINKSNDIFIISKKYYSE